MPTTEQKLRKILEGFEVKVFDPDDDKSGLITQTKQDQEPQEIDAIAKKSNIVFLISVYEGNREQETETKIKPYFRRLHYLNNAEQLNLIVSNEQSSRGRINKSWSDNLMNEIFTSDYKFILKKVCFCPNINVLPEKLRLNDDEFVIDRNLFNYFEYALDNINYSHMERELFFALKIKKRYIERRKDSRAGDEPELTSNFPAIETKLSVHQKMYSLCVTVNDIIEYTQVLRLANKYDSKAFQRMINGDRLSKISNNYLNTHDIFPNNIILSFNPDLYDVNNVNHFISNNNGNIAIKFYKEFGSLIIIDGQHRLLAHLLNQTRDINKPILINVILFLNKETAYDEMAGLFHVINTQQKRLASLVSLKIRSKTNPNELESIWYRVFESLNNLNERDNYIHNKICFDEQELRNGNNKTSIVSIIKYTGLNMVTNGIKRGKYKYSGLKSIGDNCIDAQYNLSDFYQNFLRKYFSIIGEVLTSTNSSINARDMGGLLRLIIHFINDNRTKNLFIQLCQERGSIPTNLKQNIKNYINTIPFSQLSNLDYGGNEWRSMEGFFLGCIRKRYKRFGFGDLLSKKGKTAIIKGKKFR